MAQFVKVAKITDLPPGQGLVAEAEGREIAVFNVDGTFYALDNVCCHRGGPLGEGELEGTIVTCPWHRWQYDVTTGKSPVNPAVSVECFQTKVEGDDVWVAV